MEDPRAALKEALKTAMKEKDAVARNTIRNLNAAIKQVEVDERKDVSAEDVVDIIVKQVKMLRESIAEKEAAGREDLAAEDKEQLAVMERFLPQQLSNEEIEAIVEGVIEKVGAASMKDMGKVMGALMAQVKGKADGKVVNDVVRKKLGQ
jgi:uncharacterized protein YqeY